MKISPPRSCALAAALLLAAPTLRAQTAPAAPAKPADGAASVVQCANLIYAGTQTSRCFSDEFLSVAQQKTCIPTERQLKSVKLGSDELFKFPFVVMTGEKSFTLLPKERANLKRYLTEGGFLVASAGCSNPDWAKSFEREMRELFGANALKPIPFDHPMFRTVQHIKQVKLKGGENAPPFKGYEHNGKIVVIFSGDGLNDTGHTEGCCCCGGNEIQNSLDINVNLFAYALLY